MGGGGFSNRVPWFVKQWRVPLNRCIYTSFSYMIFLMFIILYVAETQPPAIYWVDIFTAVWIISYTFRDMGTGTIPSHSTASFPDRIFRNFGVPFTLVRNLKIVTSIPTKNLAILDSKKASIHVFFNF